MKCSLASILTAGIFAVTGAAATGQRCRRRHRRPGDDRHLLRKRIAGIHAPSRLRTTGFLHGSRPHGRTPRGGRMARKRRRDTHTPETWTRHLHDYAEKRGKRLLRSRNLRCGRRRSGTAGKSRYVLCAGHRAKLVCGRFETQHPLPRQRLRNRNRSRAPVPVSHGSGTA